MTGNSHLEEGRASLQPPPQAAGSKATLSTLLTQPQQRRAATYQLHTGQQPGRSPAVPNGPQRPPTAGAREAPPHARALPSQPQPPTPRPSYKARPRAAGPYRWARARGRFPAFPAPLLAPPPSPSASPAAHAPSRAPLAGGRQQVPRLAAAGSRGGATGRYKRPARWRLRAGSG